MAIQPNIKDTVEIEETSFDGTSTPLSFQDNIKKNVIYIGGALGVILLIVLGVMLYNNSKREKQAEAAIRLSRVQQYYDAGDYEKALNGDPGKTIQGEQVKGLKQLVSEYEGTEAGKLAALYAGNSLVMGNNYNEAAKYYTIAQDADATVTRTGATAGLASCKDKSGQYNEAAELYTQAASLAKETGNEQLYQLYAALLFEKAGKNDEALKLYKEIVSTNEYSEFSGEAKAGMIRLGKSID